MMADSLVLALVALLGAPALIIVSIILYVIIKDPFHDGRPFD
jgi:hypothetical protein